MVKKDVVLVVPMILVLILVCAFGLSIRISRLADKEPMLIQRPLVENSPCGIDIPEAAPELQ